MSIEELNGLRLVGGTALALQIGHRKSIDLDLFGEVDIDELETGKNKNKYIVVVYKELDKKDGFVITSFITNKAPYFTKKKLIWKR